MVAGLCQPKVKQTSKSTKEIKTETDDEVPLASLGCKDNVPANPVGGSVEDPKDDEQSQGLVPTPVTDISTTETLPPPQTIKKRHRSSSSRKGDNEEKVRTEFHVYMLLSDSDWLLYLVYSFTHTCFIHQYI